jgi:hypothetical protein
MHINNGRLCCTWIRNLEGNRDFEKEPNRSLAKQKLCQSNKTSVQSHSNRLDQEEQRSQVPVAHACNPSYWWGRDRRILVQSQPGKIVHEILSWKNPSQIRADAVAQCVGSESQYCNNFFKRACNIKEKREVELSRSDRDKEKMEETMNITYQTSSSPFKDHSCTQS